MTDLIKKMEAALDAEPPAEWTSVRVDSLRELLRIAKAAEPAEEWKAKALSAAETLEQMKTRVRTAEQALVEANKTTEAAIERAEAYLEALRQVVGVKP